MRLSVAVVAFANITPILAAALVQRQEAELITIVLQVSKINNEKAIDVWDQARTKVLAQSCSDSLQSGLFEHDAIAFQVDENGAGTFTLGSKSFAVSDNLDQEASCGQIASAEELVITCHVPFAAPSGVPALDRRDLNDCFPKGGALDLLSVAQGFENGAQDEPLPALTSEVAVNTTADLDKRQTGPCTFWSQVTYMVGNGDPHQNPWNVQVSDPMQCPSHIGCSIGHGISHTVGWQANVGIVHQWLSGGFAVQKSVSTGNTYTCPGNAGQYLAVWRKVGTTAYTVQNANFNACTGNHPTGGRYIIWSPNAGNRGSYYYCVYGKNYVRWSGDRWLDTSPNQPGGP